MCITERPLTNYAFLQVQQSKQLNIRNEEVRRSIDDLLTLIANYPRENKEVRHWLSCCLLCRRQLTPNVNLFNVKGQQLTPKLAACCIVDTQQIVGVWAACCNADAQCGVGVWAACLGSWYLGCLSG